MLRYVLIAILTAVILGGLSRLMRASRPKQLDGFSKSISPGKVSAAITVCGGILMSAGAIALAFMESDSSISIHTGAMFLLGLAIAGFMAPSLTTLHDVSWNNLSITGPCRTFGPTLGLKRTTIGWNEIVKAGTTSSGYWFVESADGQRIYWSYLYPGYGALVQAIQTHAGQVQLPEALR